MDEELEVALESIADRLSEFHDAIEDRLSEVSDAATRIADALDTISDGLFYLNLHLGAEVKPWTGESALSDTAGQGAATGTVRWYEMERGVGFIIRDDDRRDVFFSDRVLARGAQAKAGDRVAFKYVDSEEGPIAVELDFI